MIVLVTYNHELRQTLCSFLRERGYGVSIPEHREDALPLVQQLHPKVIVLDMYNTEPNGLTFLKQLRASGYSGKVIVLNGNSNRMMTPGILQQKVDKIICHIPSQNPAPLMDQIEHSIRSLFREEIENRAFEKFLSRGKRTGEDLADWIEAEAEILNSQLKETKTQDCSSGRI